MVNPNEITEKMQIIDPDYY